MALLNSMANFNEKTVTRIHMHAIRKVTVDHAEKSNLQFVEWNHNTDFLVVGGIAGMLKVIKIAIDPTSAKFNQSTNIVAVNQALEGHSTTVIRARFNENYQKLTTCDTSGMIIVWGLNGQNGEQWVEEMINNRQKSTVADTAWNYHGTKILIVYADSTVILGTLDGNRLWIKELEHQMIVCEWCPNSDLIILGTIDGRVMVYDENGNHFLEIRMHCLEQVELEQVLKRNKDHQEEIVQISYYSPVLKSKHVMIEAQQQKEREKETVQMGNSNVFVNYPRQTQNPARIEPEKTSEPIQPIPSDRPRLVIVYRCGVMQLMRSISDINPIVIKLSNIRVRDAKWSPNGAFLAVLGTEGERQDSQLTVVHFLSAYGKRMGYFQNIGACPSGFSWHRSGFRMVVSLENICILGQIRPEFKWGSIEDTVVYVFQRDEQHTYSVMFYDYKTDEKTSKNVDYFEHMAFYQDYCVIICRKKEDRPEYDGILYTCELCNCIGTTIDYTTMTLEPKFVCLNATHALMANKDQYFIWHFVLPKIAMVSAGGHEAGVSTEYSLQVQQRNVDQKLKKVASRDQIVCTCIGDTFFLLGIQNGGIYRGNLADGVLTNRYNMDPIIDSMKLNCDFTKLAVAKLVEHIPYALVIFDFVGEELLKNYLCEKKDVWDYKWDFSDPSLLVLKDRQNICVFDGNSLSEQSTVAGNIFSFKNLVIRTVNLEMLLSSPENPTKHAFHECMIRAKQDVTSMLQAMKIDEAKEYAEKNSHAELWTMIANYSLLKKQFDDAELAFVKLADYAGIQYLKKLRNIANLELVNAEILANADKLEEAKELFMLCDRKDLAIEMYKKVGEYVPVYDLVKDDEDEEAIAEAFREIAEQYYEAMEWEDAAINFEKCGDIPRLIDSWVRCNEFGKLEVLARNMPDGGEYLEKLGDIFSAYGLCDQACESYLKVGLPQKALKTCIELNMWQKAQAIAAANHLENLDELMTQNGDVIRGGSDERSVNALGLYLRVGKYLDAARLAFEIANARKELHKPYPDLKECYVLAAILVETHRKNVREEKKDSFKGHEEPLNDEVGLTVDQIRILENTWKGAEAFHYMILAQQHFFNNRIENALQTSLILANYEEYLNPGDIHEMIALAAANVGQFGICSRAMMRLEAYEGFSEQEREDMRNLSFELFTRNDPVNPPHANISCFTCDGEMNPYDLQCPKCHIKFPICVASGKPIRETSFWVCSRCKHHAYQQEMEKCRYCPLCHMLL